LIDKYGLYEEDVYNMMLWLERYTDIKLPEFGGFKDLDGPDNEGGGVYVRNEKMFYLDKIFSKNLIDNGMNKMCETIVHESFHPDDDWLDLFIQNYFGQQWHQESYNRRARKIIDDALKKPGVPPLPDPIPYKPRINVN